MKFIRELGKGQFGKVYLGTLDGYRESLVAIKISNCSEPKKEPEARQQLLAEIETMKNAGYHSHLVQLIATCTLPENPICVVLEYVKGGDLLAHLHRLRDGVTEYDRVFNSNRTSTRCQRPSFSESMTFYFYSQEKLLSRDVSSSRTIFKKFVLQQSIKQFEKNESLMITN